MFVLSRVRFPRRRAAALACVALGTFAAPSARAQSAAPTARASTEAAPATLPAAPPTTAGPTAAPPAADAPRPMRPGDLVRLRIWREPEMSGDYPISAQGEIVLPMLGAVQVAGETPATLRERLLARYRVSLANPSVDVAVLHRIQVLGAVRTPGLYPADETMTVADVLALAGGATEVGDQRHIRLVRDGSRQNASLDARASVVQLGIRSGDQIFVPERSWVNRNAAVVVGAGITAAAYLIGAKLK